MINTRKQISTSVLESQDLFQDIFVPVNKRQGFIKSKSPNIPIYFYRYIGISENSELYYEHLHKLNLKLTTLGSLYINFTSGIPVKFLSTSISEISWDALLSSSSSERNTLISILKTKGLFPNFNNNYFNEYIQNSFDETMALYLKNEPNSTETVIKNFAVKLLGWTLDYAPKLFCNSNYNSRLEDNINNPKVLFYGDIKNHEIYFLIFLSKLSCDVIYINSLSDMGFVKIDKRNVYSKLLKLPKTQPLRNFDLKTTIHSKKPIVTDTSNIKETVIKKEQAVIENRVSPLAITFKGSINTLLKSSMNIFNDIILPVNKRIGFLGGTVPFIPVYFYRYIGIKEKEDDYYNDLFRLDKNLSMFDGLYLRLTDSIPIHSNIKLNTSCLNIWQNVDPFDASLTTKIAALLMEHKIFPTNNDTLNCSMANSFSYILDLYCKEEKNLNLSKVKNFSLKLLSWIHEFVPTLVKNFHFQDTASDEIINPKIIYYGDIKKHELLFLVFLSKIGCDVIYINSLCDKFLDITESSEIISKCSELQYKADLKEFPKEEKLIRQETIAALASRELSNSLYTDSDGFYKPWQFEEYKTQPATLKTTLYEFKLLWNESSSLRTGFRVENKTVYMPNLFAKISGVPSDLTLYWKDFFHLKCADSTLFIAQIPFTNVSYSKTDLYSLAFVLNTSGFVDEKKLLAHSCYKFSYLKTSLQHIILEKINYLIKTDMLKKTIDKDFKLKILMIILNTDKNILQLIQQYDYPSKIPKLLIYDNNENIFSDEDSIMLCFLNLFGLDISILTPTGYNNIEGKIQEKFYDIHRLEEVNFNLPLPDFNDEKRYTKEKGKGFLSNIFNFK
ncbi:YceG family protein [Clostridium bowmanii]|uniref:YceG family protein n=1 Tax=Clostridium bowmanii TaxID=132925 RepID=UPI001C0DA94C|nr:YceG family protein [Clostridium bowmanii]MBU3191772.1 YceG family protein [Clostridium bowmanii]MCA1075945.1 YceG family protein [Clostridium bowmanii]